MNSDWSEEYVQMRPLLVVICDKGREVVRKSDEMLISPKG